MKNEFVNNLSRLNFEDFPEYQRRFNNKRTIFLKQEEDPSQRFNKSVYEIIKHNLSSSALGSNEMYYINTLGRINMDIMKIVQKDYKLESYKLDNVAYHFTGQRKDDISPK